MLAFHNYDLHSMMFDELLMVLLLFGAKRLSGPLIVKTHHASSNHVYFCIDSVTLCPGGAMLVTDILLDSLAEYWIKDTNI